MRTLVLPVAGESTGYPGLRPKYILLHPYGPKMLTEAIRGIRPEWFDNILIIGLQKHEDEYGHMDPLKKEIAREFGIEESRVSYVLLPEQTKNQPETVVKGLQKAGVEEGSIAIKDCDNYFMAIDDKSAFERNFVTVANLSDVGKVKAGNKSYVVMGKKKTITNIVEKQIIGGTFCSGLYYFKDINDFIQVYQKHKNTENLYISHLIYDLILQDKVFFAEQCEHYIDWGTHEDWCDYTKDFKTLFIDLDGTLLKSSAKDFGPVRWGDAEPIQENIDYVNKLYDDGKVVVVITTGRTPECKALTEQELRDKGIKHHILLCGLPHTKRVLINDFATSMPYPSAVAVNLPRDTNKLGELLDGC